MAVVFPRWPAAGLPTRSGAADVGAVSPPSDACHMGPCSRVRSCRGLSRFSAPRIESSRVVAP